MARPACTCTRRSRNREPCSLRELVVASRKVCCCRPLEPPPEVPLLGAHRGSCWPSWRPHQLGRYSDRADMCSELSNQTRQSSATDAALPATAEVLPAREGRKRDASRPDPGRPATQLRLCPRLACSSCSGPYLASCCEGQLAPVCCILGLAQSRQLIVCVACPPTPPAAGSAAAPVVRLAAADPRSAFLPRDAEHAPHAPAAASDDSRSASARLRFLADAPPSHFLIRNLAHRCSPPACAVKDGEQAHQKGGYHR